MKGHKLHPAHIHTKASELIHARKSGGRLKGVDEAEKDLKDKPEDAEKHEHEEEHEAEEKELKRGGKAKERKRGGKAEKKHVGKVEGEEHRAHGGRAPRKRGGSCEASPFSSAKAGEAAHGRKLAKETMD